MQEGNIQRNEIICYSDYRRRIGGEDFLGVDFGFKCITSTIFLFVLLVLNSQVSVAQTIPGPPSLNFGEPTSKQYTTPSQPQKQAEIQKMPTNTNTNTETLSPALLRAQGDSRVYEIVGGKRHWISSLEVFREKRFAWSNVMVVSQSKRDSYPRISLLRKQGDPKVYYLTETGLIRHIPNAETFLSYGNSWGDIYDVTATELDSYRTNNLVQRQGDSKVYKLEGEVGSIQKRWITSAERFNELKFRWDEVAVINQTELNLYSAGTPL